jgi:hypothetical protein
VKCGRYIDNKYLIKLCRLSFESHNLTSLRYEEEGFTKASIEPYHGLRV